MPPGFPPIEIEGEQYWDGGLVSNTPLDWVVESQPHLDTLAFQVDLWSARGELPRTLVEVSTRQKEIQYSSRTRASTDSFKRIQRLRRVMADLLDKLPEELDRSPEAALLRKVADRRSTISYTSTTAPRITRGLRRIMSSHGGAWRTTGVPGITTRSILCAIAKCSNGPPTRKASSLSTSPWTDVNRRTLRHIVRKSPKAPSHANARKCLPWDTSGH
jgi:hypothetical protein